MKSLLIVVLDVRLPRALDDDHDHDHDDEYDDDSDLERKKNERHPRKNHDLHSDNKKERDAGARDVYDKKIIHANAT